MGVRLLLISDTHLPVRAKDLPLAVWDEVEQADVVVHAGDWVDVATLDRVEKRARQVVGVAGNNDGPDLHARLPLVARCELGGLRFAVVHQTGDSPSRERRMTVDYPDTDVLVFGHSPIPWDTVTASGLRLLNPGSPTDRRRQPFCTYMTVQIQERRLDVQLHRLPPRR